MSERAISGGNFFTKNLFILTAGAAYLLACFSPAWGLGWGSPVLTVWTAFVLALLTVGTLRLISPGRSYPMTDLGFIVPLILAVNLFSAALGSGGHWLKPLNFLVIALCALYYSIGFNFLVAGLIFALEAMNLLVGPGGASLEPLVNLGVFGAYLAGAVLVLGRLLKIEHRKKERAVQAIRKMEEGAKSLGHGLAEEDAVKSMSPDTIKKSMLDSAASLDVAMGELLDAAGTAIPCDNAMIFMAASSGDGVYLRHHLGGSQVMENAFINYGQGLVGWVAKEKKPLLVHEDARGIGYIEKGYDSGSLVASPLLNGGVLEGVIALDSKRDAAFTERDKETLCKLAVVAIYILQNARVYQKVDLTARNSAALHRISSEISSSLDIKTVLEKFAELTGDVIPYDYMTISFVHEGDKAVFKVLKGYAGVKPPAGPVPLEGSLLGWIVGNRQPLSFNDMNKRTEKLPIYPVRELQTGCRSFLGVPLISRDKVLGVVTLAVKEAGAISGYQQHMLSVIANQVVANITNASLHNAMQKMATTDGLTGLINHRHFQDKAAESVSRAQRYPEPLSILLFDIDHFKKVNDTYGHPVGDKVLKKVAGLLGEAVREVDVAARYGGEEFIVLLANTDEKGALKMAERIRTKIQKASFDFDGKTIPVTISVGCSTFPSDSADKDGLIDKADQALYWSKTHGRNQACSFSSISLAARAAKPEIG